MPVAFTMPSANAVLLSKRRVDWNEWLLQHDASWGGLAARRENGTASFSGRTTAGKTTRHLTARGFFVEQKLPQGRRHRRSFSDTNGSCCSRQDVYENRLCGQTLNRRACDEIRTPCSFEIQDETPPTYMNTFRTSIDLKRFVLAHHEKREVSPNTSSLKTAWS